jgi:hypothetical protein
MSVLSVGCVVVRQQKRHVLASNAARQEKKKESGLGRAVVEWLAVLDSLDLDLTINQLVYIKHNDRSLQIHQDERRCYIPIPFRKVEFRVNIDPGFVITLTAYL